MHRDALPLLRDAAGGQNAGYAAGTAAAMAARRMWRSETLTSGLNGILGIGALPKEKG